MQVIALTSPSVQIFDTDTPGFFRALCGAEETLHTRVDHPTAWRARMLPNAAFGGEEAIELRSAVPMESTRGADRAGGGVQRAAPGEAGQPLTAAITAPVIYVGDDSKAAIASASVKGKIAVYSMEAAPASFYSSRTPIQDALAADAVGVVSIYNVPGIFNSSQVRVRLPCRVCNWAEKMGPFSALIERAARAGASDKLVMEMSVTRAPHGLAATPSIPNLRPLRG